MLLITGGSGSGKSAYAEDRIIEYPGRRIYIATMMPFGEEGKKRVDRHRKLREDKAFTTIEQYTDLVQLCEQHADCLTGASVLLECMSNLMANELFAPEGTGEYAAEEIMRGVKKLNTLAGQLVIVTNEVFSDGLEYEAETMNYIHKLGILNQQLAAMAAEVAEVVYTIPVIHKVPEVQRKGGGQS